MGLFSRSKPKIKIQTTKKDGYSGWLKCTHCDELVHQNEVTQNTNCCPKCDYHYRLSAHQRITSLLDVDSFTEHYSEYTSIDPLQFMDTISYSERLKKASDVSKLKEAVICGKGKIEGIKVAIGVMDFNFMAGSMGSVVGEKLTLLIEQATKDSLPLIIISTSGGARMQESSLSLMQMAKTAAALGRLGEEGIPYISVLTNPTTGGVTASFAALGDILIAEPKALICFAGPRVIEQVTGQALPPDAQKSEFLLEHGMIDMIVPRCDLRTTLLELLQFLTFSSFQSRRSISSKKSSRFPQKIRELMELGEDE